MTCRVHNVLCNMFGYCINTNRILQEVKKLGWSMCMRELDMFQKLYINSLNHHKKKNINRSLHNN